MEIEWGPMVYKYTDTWYDGAKQIRKNFFAFWF